MLCITLFSPATCYALSGVFRPVIRLLSEQMRKRDSISIAARDFSVFQSAQTESAAHTASYSTGTGYIFS